MNRALYPFLLALAYLFSLYLYGPSLDWYFFQDDFFEINISRVATLRDYLSLFKFRNDIIDWRPISQQTFFFLSYNFFGLNALVARFIIFIFFFINGFLISKLIFQITKNFKVSILTSVFWLTSAVHFMGLTWIAAGTYNIIGTFFWLVTSLFFLKYTASQRSLFYILAIASFFLALGSYEFSLTWPVIFGLYHLYVLKNPLTLSIKFFSPFAIMSLIYLYAKLLFHELPQIPEYQLALNLESAKSLFWYILWSFNISEEFKKQVTANLVFMNPIFLAEFWTLTAKSFISFLYLIILAVAVPVFLVVKEKINLNIRLIFFFLAFFTIAISPVLILPNHAFSMYLTLAAIGLYALLAYLLTIIKNRLLLASVLVIWLFSSATTVGFYRHNSWMIESQKTARTFALNMLEKFPVLPKNSIVYYYLPYSWQHQALGDGHAIKTIYNDQSLSVYYNEEALHEAVKEDKHRFIFDSAKTIEPDSMDKAERKHTSELEERIARTESPRKFIYVYTE